MAIRHPALPLGRLPGSLHGGATNNGKLFTLKDAENNLTIGSIGYSPASQIITQNRSNDSYAWTGHGSGSTASIANGLNQLTSIGGSATAHDTKGNLTTDPTSGKGYTYSSENLLKTSSGGTAATLTYDPAMRLYELAAGATTRFGYDGIDLIAEYDGSNALLRRYVPGPGVDEPIVWYEGTGTTDRRWLHADERGSVIAVSDATGVSLATNRYDEYGKPQSGNIGRFQYTGQKWLSEINLYDYKARMYAAHLGRFMQTDPIGYRGGPNLYTYVRNDPMNWVDPLGLGGTPGDDDPKPIDPFPDIPDPYQTADGTVVVTGCPWCAPPGILGSFLVNSIFFPTFDLSPGGGGDVNIATRPPAQPPKPKPPLCSRGRRITIGIGPSVTGFFGLIGGSAGISLNVSIPMSLWRTGFTGSQAYLQGNAAYLGGLGGFVALGPSVSVGHVSGPVTSGFSRQDIVQGGAAWGGGGEASAPITKEGFAGGASVSGGPRAGYGLFGAGGPQGTATAATRPVGC